VDPSDRIQERKPVQFIHALLPIAFLSLVILYGLIARPLFLNREALSLETVFVLASFFSVSHLFYLGLSWETIQDSIVRKISSALPAFFILFAIGIIISSWMICGTIPMLVYYGLEMVEPRYLYLVAFLIPVVFSSLTGTSWGSVGTVGVVIMGMASALEANLGITAGAIIGGAYFGDKLSPLSDTTNLAALAANVDLFDHIRSMTVTTIPSAMLASVGYLILGFTHPPALQSAELDTLTPFRDSLTSIFQFNLLLLIPPAIVLIGSIRKKPTIPTLLASVLSAFVLALIFQRFTLADVSNALSNGFDTAMTPWATDLPEQTIALVNRGGLYSMSQAIFVAFLVFFFIGSIDTIDAMPTVVSRVCGFAKTRSATILSALAATGLTNALTSNQYATSFIVGDAFKSRFDHMKIPRKVLSRSLEDYGTMIESIVPWTSTAVFMVATLGVPWAEYWNWQLLSLINLLIAPMFALTGKGCFYHEIDHK
jgi:NhaC family Na+:H+ antiporter